MTIEFVTAGESHGQGLTAIINGVPAGLEINEETLKLDLARRQKGYGRGGRMKIETDTAKILSGIRLGKTTGAPITFFIENKDWENWHIPMSIDSPDFNNPVVREQIIAKKITHVRPGHADFAGALKYNHHDVRDVLERSSARETAARVAVGGIAKTFLSSFNVSIFSHVLQIGSVQANHVSMPYSDLIKKVEASETRCADPIATEKMKAIILEAGQSGTTLGGVIEIIALGVPLGLGSYTQWNKRIDGVISQYIMSIPAIKAIEFGMGFDMAYKSGDVIHDQFTISPENPLFYRQSNNAGGIEGGITNGNPIVIRTCMKPIPTMKKPLQSIDLETKQEHLAHYERSDICAVPAAGVVCEAMLAIALWDQFLMKFGGDSMDEIRHNYTHYTQQYKSRL